jgi:hypothetical protein
MEIMKRFRILAMLSFVLLSACAGTQQASKSTSWEKFQSEIIAQRDEGKISPVQAQLELWSKYRELYGEDATVNGYYAFSVKILSAAEAGKLSQGEAQAIIDAREPEIAERRRVAEATRNSFFYPYGIPPNQ